ncbi:MAG: class I SAM-dependent methyltransferase [Alphaproteobacteria bacterium]
MRRILFLGLYAFMASNSSYASYDDLLEHISSHRKDSGHRVLIAGCGKTDELNSIAAFLGENGKVFAYDKSEEYVKYCQKHVQPDARIQVSKMQAEKPPKFFKNGVVQNLYGSFDLVHCNINLRKMKQNFSLLAIYQMYLLLKPGGTFSCRQEDQELVAVTWNVLSAVEERGFNLNHETVVCSKAVIEG